MIDLENTKEKIIIGLCIVIFIGLCIFIYKYTFINSKIYYTKIDNTKVERISIEKYEYNLKGYDKDGESKDLKFETTRELRDTAYLKVECMLFRGVISWSEVELEDIPEKAGSKLK